MRKRILIAAISWLLAHSVALAQSSPGLVTGQVPTAAQWNSYFSAKQDVLGFVPLNRAGGTMLGPLVTVASSTSAAGLRLVPGAAPTAPVNGDMWTTSAGIFYRNAGATIGPLVSAVIDGNGIVLSGSTSGTTTLRAAAVAGTTTIRFPGGSTDFSATGGTAQVVFQTSAGGAFTVARPSCATLSDPTFCNVSLTNGITLGNVAQIAAFTLLGNATGSTANIAAISITSLTQKEPPVGGDYLLLSDQSAAGALKRVLVSSVSALGAVSTFNGRSGTVLPQANDYGNFGGLALKNCTLSASVAANALTIALKDFNGADPTASTPCVVVFRSNTLTSGVTAALSVTAATSLVIPATATMGVSNSIPFNIWVTGHSDGGTFRLGAIKATSSTQITSLNDWFKVTTTASTTASDSANVIYTGTAIGTAAPYRTLGFMTWSSGLVATGGWAVVPDVIQLHGPGVPLPGQSIGNVVSATAESGTTCTTSASYQDSALTATITTKSAANYVQVYYRGNILAVASAVTVIVAMRRGGAVLPTSAGGLFSSGATGIAALGPFATTVSDPALTAGAITYTAACKSDGTNAMQFPNNLSEPSGNGAGLIVLTEIQG